jgi:transglutaminase-like putative cysteine protease
MSRRFLRAFFVIALFFSLYVSCFAQSVTDKKTRHFRFDYNFTVNVVDPGQRLRVWFPIPQSDSFQSVKVISAKGDLPLKTYREKEYGNELYYAETSRTTKDRYQFAVTYEITRREAEPGPVKQVTSARTARFLQPDHLVPTSGLPADLAVRETAGKTAPYEKARAIYDYVFRTVRYDKTGTGWGNGDTLWVCDSKHGNCTDFHSLFMSMARSQQIPSRFQIGFSVPAAKSSADIAGYHCWSSFFVNGTGWVPVDISEAWKHQELKDYYFGHQDASRVEFATGRDLRLSPSQEGAPLNYFVYPYVELGGKVHSNVNLGFKYQAQDMPAAGSAVTAK